MDLLLDETSEQKGVTQSTINRFLIWETLLYVSQVIAKSTKTCCNTQIFTDVLNCS